MELLYEMLGDLAKKWEFRAWVSSITSEANTLQECALQLRTLLDEYEGT